MRPAGPSEEWWDDAPTYAEADVVPLTSGQVTTGIDAQMITGGTISGRVTDEFGDRLPGVCVYVPGHPPENSSPPTPTAATGSKPPGRRPLPVLQWCFSPEPLQGEWFDDALRVRDATPVAVTLGSEVTARRRALAWT